MITRQDIIREVDSFFANEYEIIEGMVIPNVDDLRLGNHAKAIDAAMLFIDIRESTKIVDSLRRVTSARMYKSFLWGVAQIAKLNDGELRSFNGDGVLIVFMGNLKRTNASKASFQMSWFCQEILKPKMEEYFKKKQQINDLDFNFGIGIDVGRVLVIRGGIRGDNNNDLVWVGNATNYAVKLSSRSTGDYHIYISADVYKNMDKTTKFGGNPKSNM
jgi:class 3 adenylate cyclase